MDSHFNLSGYNCFKQTRKSNGGGTAIILNEKIKFRNFTTSCDGIEATILDAHLGGQWIKIITIYIPPRLDQFNQNTFFNARMLLAGDSLSNSIGIHIARFIQNNHINPIFSKTPTCYRSANGSYIDFFLVSPSLNITNDSISTYPSFSYHLAIKLDITFNNSPQSTNNNITLFSYSYVNISGINNFLLSELKKLQIPKNNNIGIADTDCMASSIENIFSEAIQTFVPQLKIPMGKILLSTQTLSLKTKYRNTLRKFLRNRLHPNANFLYKQSCLMKNMYLNSVKHDISNYYKNFISKTAWNTEVHNLIRHTTGYKRRINNKNDVLTTTDNQTVVGGALSKLMMPSQETFLQITH